MPDPESTEVITSPTGPVSSAQTIIPSEFRSTTTADVNAFLQQERRARELQSIADRAKEDAARAAAALAAREQELQALKDSQKSIIDGAASAAQEAINRSRELEQRLNKAEAETAKAEALLQHPELRPYAAFIPATTDQTQMAQFIETFKAARQADLAAVTPPPTPSTPPSSPAPSVLDLYPRGHYQVPAASPSRPPSDASGQGSMTDQIQAKLDAAKLSNDPRAFEQAIKEAAAMAQTDIQRTIGYHPQAR
jgi:hypothetical protein